MREFSAELLNPREFKPLPREALNLCRELNASSRLVAHLTLVHDTALRLCAELRGLFPSMQIDSAAVSMGAALHDIGKADVREELSAPGKLHEMRGAELLEQRETPGKISRFALTHGNWTNGAQLELDDLLVALADNCWKGKRVTELEDLVVERISRQTGEPLWSVFSALDEILQGISARADARLEWQKSFPVD